MHFPDDAVSIEFNVPFHDVDALRIVWHGHYLKYLEIARTEFLKSKRLDVYDVVDLGYGFLVAESRLHHSSPLRYGDRARVTAWCLDHSHRLNIAYEVRNLTENRRSARGSTKLVTVDQTGKLIFETPLEIRSRLEGKS